MDRDGSASKSELSTGYAEVDDVNAEYRMLRREATRLRRRAVRPDDVKFTDDPAFVEVIRACTIESRVRSSSSPRTTSAGRSRSDPRERPNECRRT